MENTTCPKDIYDIIIENLTNEWRLSMSNKIPKTEWARPIYSKKQINKAGQIIANSDSSQEDRNNALEIINNWRATHAYPLHVIKCRIKTRKSKCYCCTKIKKVRVNNRKDRKIS